MPLTMPLRRRSQRHSISRGWGSYILDGCPTYLYKTVNLERYEITGDRLVPGRHTVRYQCEYDGGGAGKGGTGRLLVDGAQVAEGRIDGTMGYRISLDGTFDIGSDAGEPVSEDFHVPFDFKGTLDNVVVELYL